jgi:iron(III) transport system permease protein
MQRSKQRSSRSRWASNAPARGGAGVAAWTPSWPSRANGTWGWTLFAAALAGIILLPLGTILVLALGSEQNVWPHLVQTVLPRALGDTLMLMGGVGVITLSLGTAAAWLITMYRFPGRDLLDRLLVLPLAMPTYIVAYCYVELLDYSGPVQQLLRALFGWHSARDYWFFEVRSFGGCVLVLSSVLYPYVYLSARASFAQQSVCVLEVARTLGQTPIGAFRSVALPLARPALAAGVALSLMECLNDLGAAQYLGVQTLTVSIYTTWLQHSNLAGAAQIALVALLLVLALLVGERAARGGARVHHTTGRYRSIPFSDLAGWRAYAVAVACSLPVIAGFVVPLLVLVAQASTYLSEALMLGFWRAVRNTLTVAGVAAISTVSVGLALVYARRLTGDGPATPCRAPSWRLGFCCRSPPSTMPPINCSDPRWVFPRVSCCRAAYSSSCSPTPCDFWRSRWDRSKPASRSCRQIWMPSPAPWARRPCLRCAACTCRYWFRRSGRRPCWSSSMP